MKDNNETHIDTQSTQQQLIVDALLKDRRSERRWRNFRFFVYVFLLLAIILLIIYGTDSSDTKKITKQPYVALVRLNGIIMPGTDFSAEKVIPQLNDAFSDKAAKGVVLVINSPGGTPVQASIIHDKIMALKQQYHKKVIVVGEDTLASGAYLLATAADQIYVSKDTLTGSIGVIMAGFGLNDAIAKLGITRRVFTAGDNKDRLDPFAPLKPEDEAKVERVLAEVHQSFIQNVLDSRGKKLQGDQKELFSGDFWTGTEATKLGLVDGTANLWDVMQQQFDVKYYVDYSRRPSLVQMIFGDINSELNLGLMSRETPLKAELPSM